MKVKELIEALQKQDPEYNIHIWVDDEVGCGAGEFGKYYATKIDILGHDKYYQLEEEIKSLAELEEEVYDENQNFSDEDIKKEALLLASQLKKLEGIWIKIQL